MTGPCIGCPSGTKVQNMWYGAYNRVFPETVNSVNKYLDGNYNYNREQIINIKEDGSVRRKPKIKLSKRNKKKSY